MNRKLTKNYKSFRRELTLKRFFVKTFAKDMQKLVNQLLSRLKTKFFVFNKILLKRICFDFRN